MMFQQLVFRTTPQSLVEWLDGELDKRGIDRAYTHCILSILHQDSDYVEPEEEINNRNSQLKVYQKHEGPKYQKQKKCGKQLFISNINSNSDSGRADLQRRKRNAAINCLKSVSDEKTLEDLVDEVILKLKNIRNENAPEKKDSVKSFNPSSKETAFFILPSSPTDQVEKYNQAFPSLVEKNEENIEVNNEASMNVWYKDCIGKNKSIVQDIFKNSNLSSFKNSENFKSMSDNSFGSLKSIENIYPPQIDNYKSVNRLKISYTSKKVENKFSCENNSPMKRNKDEVDSISSSSVIESSHKKDLNLEISNRNLYKEVPNKKSKRNSRKRNRISNEIHKTDLGNRESASHGIPSGCKKVKNTNMADFTSNKFSILMEEERVEIISTTLVSSKKLINYDATESHENIVTPTEKQSNPYKKFKSCENITRDNEENPCPCKDETQLDFVGNIESEIDKVNEVIPEENNLACFASCGKGEILWEDNSTNLMSDHSQTNFKEDQYVEIISENYFENNDSEEIFSNASHRKTCAEEGSSKILTNVKKQKKLKTQQTQKTKVKFSPSIQIMHSKLIEKCAADLDLLSPESSLDESHEEATTSADYDCDDSSENTQVSLHRQEIIRRFYTSALKNINLIIFGNDIYYNFSPIKALNFFSPNEIFNIITVGDKNEVTNFLKKFSLHIDSEKYDECEQIKVSDDQVCQSFEVEKPIQNKFSCSLQPEENLSLCSHNIPHVSAFKPVQKAEQPQTTHSSNICGQNLLKKAINIDRSILRINAKSKVSSFGNADDAHFASQYDGHTRNNPCPVDIHNDSIHSHQIGASNVFNCDSYYDKSNLLSNENFERFQHNWSKLCSKSAENVSDWEKNISNLEYIWGKDNEFVKTEECSRVDNSNLNAIQKEFQLEQGKLLNDIYSMTDLKDEINLLYPIKQPVSNQVFDSTYKLNPGPSNESLDINVEKFSGVSLSVPAQTITDISDSNKTFDFSLSVPQADSVGVFSLDNCKNDTVDDQQLICSGVDYPMNINSNAYQEPDFLDASNAYQEPDFLNASNAYQEPDFLDASAFQGPYGSYSENPTNYMEGGGWSLDSEGYLLESKDYHDLSSSLQDLNIADLGNEYLQYTDNPQFSSENDELVHTGAIRRLPNSVRRRVKNRCPSSKKPCTFYLEGNCSRNDCKYSHDLSHITCRFWVEDSCFKGSTCPFLHGYAQKPKIVDKDTTSRKRESEKRYSLESEIDFPSLSLPKSEKTPAPKSDPVDIVSAKELKNSKQTNR